MADLQIEKNPSETSTEDSVALEKQKCSIGLNQHGFSELSCPEGFDQLALRKAQIVSSVPPMAKVLEDLGIDPQVFIADTEEELRSQVKEAGLNLSLIKHALENSSVVAGGTLVNQKGEVVTYEPKIEAIVASYLVSQARAASLEPEVPDIRDITSQADGREYTPEDIMTAVSNAGTTDANRHLAVRQLQHAGVAVGDKLREQYAPTNDFSPNLSSDIVINEQTYRFTQGDRSYKDGSSIEVLQVAGTGENPSSSFVYKTSVSSKGAFYRVEIGGEDYHILVPKGERPRLEQ